MSFFKIHPRGKCRGKFALAGGEMMERQVSVLNCISGDAW